MVEKKKREKVGVMRGRALLQRESGIELEIAAAWGRREKAQSLADAERDIEGKRPEDDAPVEVV